MHPEIHRPIFLCLVFYLLISSRAVLRYPESVLVLPPAPSALRSSPYPHVSPPKCPWQPCPPAPAPCRLDLTPAPLPLSPCFSFCSLTPSLLSVATATFLRQVTPAHMPSVAPQHPQVRPALYNRAFLACLSLQPRLPPPTTVRMGHSCPSSALKALGTLRLHGPGRSFSSPSISPSHHPVCLAPVC